MIFPPPSLLSTTEEDDSHDRFALHAFQLGLITIVPPTMFFIQTTNLLVISSICFVPVLYVFNDPVSRLFLCRQDRHGGSFAKA